MNDSNPPSASDAPPKPHKLFTFSSGGWVVLLASIFTLVAAALVLYPVYVTGFHPAVGDGKNIDTYGFDLTNLSIPKASLYASGNPKDGIRVIPEVIATKETATPDEIDMIAKNEHIRFLVPTDRVIGVTINGVSRAYPVRILNLHELVNDNLGGDPIAITWSPLCEAAVVFDRRIDGPTQPPLEFGNSGILLSSNTIFFDRRSDPKHESLWPQLTLHAISGPALGKPLTLIPYELVTWQQWRKDHPDTRVLLGLRTLKREYGADRYSTYRNTDDLRFPVSPLWSDPLLRRKTPIIVTSTNGTTWTASLSPQPSPATTSTSSAPANPSYQIETFLFAWYAQHPNDTDYSALKK